jgi:hypothetical protein
LRPFSRRLALLGLAFLLLLTACSPRQLLVQGVADALSSQAGAPEDDLQLARESSAFYLKLSESVLRQTPDNLGLAQAVVSGFTQYAYAFVQFEADQREAREPAAAAQLRQRAAHLYQRALKHGLATWQARHPGFAQALAKDDAAAWPVLTPEEVGLAYWTSAAWGSWIALSTDQPEVVADLPLAIRLATLAWQRDPGFGQGALAALMGRLETVRPGGTRAQTARYFDQAQALGQGRNAGVLVGRAEALALPAGDRPAFEALLQEALKAAQRQGDLANLVMRERAQWLLAQADDLF